MSSLIDKLLAQNFGENDSQIASTLMHPLIAAMMAKDKFKQSVKDASMQPQFDETSWTGYRQSTDEQAVSAATTLAGLIQTGALPFAPRTAGGTVGSIAPLQQSEAFKSKQLLQQGMSTEDLWKTKGHFPFGDFMFKEIPDTNAKIVHKPSGGGYVSDILHHPELLNDYPTTKQLGDISVVPNKNLSGSATYTGKIEVPPGHYDLSTILHELTHARLEDMPEAYRGTSPKSLSDDQLKHLQSRLKAPLKAAIKQLSGEARDNLVNRFYSIFNSNVHPMSSQSAEAGMEAYSSNPGEVLARLVEHRLPYSAEQLKNEPPLSTLRSMGYLPSTLDWNAPTQHNKLKLKLKLKGKK